MSENEKTELIHWESAWAVRPRLSFPSGLDIGTYNVLRLLKRYLRPGLRYVEVGCAPGKILSWVAREVRTQVSGIDYSPTGVDTAKWLCKGLGVNADIHCEDAMSSSFESGSFDLVFSCGLIEHFEDPAPMVAAHIRLLAHGGTALIAIPKYSGVYLKMQRWCDPENLSIHNLNIMGKREILALAPTECNLTARAFYFGNFSPWLISLSSRLGLFGNLISWGLNFVGHIQPVEVEQLSPLLVLEIKKASKPDSDQ